MGQTDAMSMSPVPHHPVWDQFRIDPRQAPQMRLSDRDRDAAREVLASAYADGQLSHPEYSERLDRASEVSTFGELVPVIGDLTVTTGRAATVAPAPVPLAEPTGKRRGLDTALSIVGGIAGALVAVNVVIWLLVAINLGSNWNHLYFWPVWVALGLAIPVGILAVIRHATDTEQDQIKREQHRLRRRQLRARRRQRRRELGQ